MILGLPFLIIGYAGAGIQDWKTMRVSDIWMFPMVVGTGLFLYPDFAWSNFLVGISLMVVALKFYRRRQIGSGDVGPLTMTGFLLGIWVFGFLLFLGLEIVIYRKMRKGKHAPAVALITLAVFLMLPIVVIGL